MDKKDIDRVRDSAMSMQVGGPGEGEICTMIDMESALYVVKEHSVYALQLADQVDPERTNISVPNTQQRILSMGSSSPEVARIFLTANSMFKAKYLGEGFPEGKARALAFNYLRDIVAMKEMHSVVLNATDRAIAGFNNVVEKDRSIKLPSLEHAAERFDAFAQKVGHAIDTLEAIARLFYLKELSKKWIDSMTLLVAQKYGEDEPLTRFMREIGANLLYMREMRNMIEHPKEDSKVNVRDFQFAPSMELVPPCVEVVTPGKSPISEPLTPFMSRIIEELAYIGEMFIALLCGARVKSVAGFPLVVVSIPPSRRPEWNPHQQMAYGIVINGEVQLLG